MRSDVKLCTLLHYLMWESVVKALEPIPHVMLRQFLYFVFVFLFMDFLFFFFFRINTKRNNHFWILNSKNVSTLNVSIQSGLFISLEWCIFSAFDAVFGQQQFKQNREKKWLCWNVHIQIWFVYDFISPKPAWWCTMFKGDCCHC